MRTGKIVFWEQEIDIAIGHSNEEFRVTGTPLVIPEMNDGIVYELRDLHGVGFRKYAVGFNIDSDIKGSTIAHEMWHLFTHILSYVSGEGESFAPEELNKEAYAYMFGKLFGLVNDKLHELLKKEKKNGRSNKVPKGKRDAGQDSQGI